MLHLRQRRIHVRRLAVRLVAADEDSDQKERTDGNAAKRRQRTPDGHESRESVSHETRAKHEQGDGGGEAAQRKAQKDSLEHISHVT
jgi:hypothetical protein